MGRNSRAKKERRAAKAGSGRGGARKPGGKAGGPVVMTVPLGNGGHVDDGCPICVAMRDMGVAEGEPMSDAQLERLMQAFGEAEKVGGIRLGPPPERN